MVFPKGFSISLGVAPSGGIDIGPRGGVLPFERVGRWAGSWSSTVYNATVPTGTEDGMLMVAFFGADSGSTLTSSSGFTKMWDQANGRAHHSAWYKIASGEGATVQFNSSNTQVAIIDITTYSGAGIPEAWASQSLGSNSVNHFCTATTVITDGSIVMRSALGGWAGFVHSNGGRGVELGDHTAGTGDGGCCFNVTEELDQPPGSTGLINHVCNASLHYAAGTVVIPPA